MRHALFVLLAVVLPCGAAMAGDPFTVVLTDNAVGDEPAIETGVAYVATPDYTNPADSTGRRLFDRDRPWGPDWNATVGFNWKDQTVDFDFKAAFRFSRFSFRMGRPQRPAHIDVAVADLPDGPWRKVGRVVPQEKDDWHHFEPEAPVTGRYVRAFFKLNDWGWYISEVKFWGVSADEPGADRVMPLVLDENRLVLVDRGRPSAGIVVAADAPAAIVKHARFLQTTIRKMTGATLPLRDDSRKWDGAIIDLTGTDNRQRDCGVHVGDGKVTLSGDAGYAVYALLQQLGCGWFAPEPLYHVIPKSGTLAIAPRTMRQKPAFAYRAVWNVFPQAAHAWRLGGSDVHSGHNYSNIIPPDEYFDDHPEYFPLIDGQRQKGGQICFANPDVRRITIEKARAWFDAHPEYLTYSLSANDTGGFCTCQECGKLGPNPGGRTLAYANAVASELAKTHPDRMVCFLAYWYSAAAPPAGVRAEPNVMVMVVNHGDHAHALDDPRSKTNVGWCANFEKWVATGAKMAIYEWYIPGCSHKHWRRLPWISIEAAYRNLRYWRKHGVKWITYESQPAYEDGNGYPRRWPLYYLAARGLWDPDENPNKVLRHACDALYGPAGEAMCDYFKVLDRAMAQVRLEGSIWNLPPAKPIYHDEVIERVRAVLDKAIKAAASHTDAYKRVAVEVALWHEAEQALRSLPDDDRHMIDARGYNGGIWYTEKAALTGKLLSDIVGFTAAEGVFVITPDGRKQQVVDGASYPVAGGVRIAR